MRQFQHHRTNDGLDMPSNGWLCTFNDMMTLLLVFFVLLFSMGTIDGPMLQEFQKALQSGLGVLEAGYPAATDAPRQHSRPSSDGRQSPDDQTMKKMVARMAERINQGAQIPLVKVGGQGQIMMDNNLLFAFGKADLNPAGESLLRRLADEFRQIPHLIRIEGHTDNIPIRTVEFPSNWELSTARAVRVVKYLINHGRIAPARLMAAGYAASKPLQPNTSPSHRAANRRVEIVLLKGKANE
jgi:chemotaxis protein MotB